MHEEDKDDVEDKEEEKKLHKEDWNYVDEREEEEDQGEEVKKGEQEAEIDKEYPHPLTQLIWKKMG